MAKLFGRDISEYRKTRIIIAVILIISFVFVFFNTEKLSTSPFESEFLFDEPFFAVSGQNNITAVMDSIGSRVVILSEDNKVINIILYNGFSEITPSYAKSLAISDNKIYILDRMMSDVGVTTRGEKILCYGTDGEYIKTLVTTDDISCDDLYYRMLNISADEEKVYVTMYSVSEDDEKILYVGDISDGNLKITHEFSTDGESIYDAFYDAGNDVTTAVTQKGNVFIFQGDSVSKKQLSETNNTIDDIYLLENGSIIALDKGNNTISVYSDDMERNDVICETSADNFAVCGNVLMYADPNNYTLNFTDMDTRETVSISSVGFSDKIIVFNYLTWIFLVAALLCAIYIGASFLYFLILRIKNNSESETHGQDHLLTTVSLYGKMIAFLILIFAITAGFVGKYQYDLMLNNAESNLLHVGYSLREISPSSIGPALCEIKGQADYGSDNYNLIKKYTESLCMTGVEANNSINLSCRVYKFLPDSDDIMVIIDPECQNRIGTVITKSEQEDCLLRTTVENTKSRHVSSGVTTYANNTVLYELTAPVYDESGNVVGSVTPIMDETIMSSRIEKEIFTELLNVFTLLCGIVIIMAESCFAYKIVKIKKSNIKLGIKNETPAEVSRTLETLASLSDVMILLFVTLTSYYILSENGTPSPIMLALPLTVNSIGYGSGTFIGSPIVKYNAKLFMIIGAIGTVLSGIIGLIAVNLSSIIILCICCFISGLGCAINTVSAKSIQLFGKIPKEENKLLVYSGMERSITFAIGGALGAVIRNAFGDTGLMIAVITIGLLIIPFVIYFVGNDLRTEKNEKLVEHSSVVDVIKSLLPYFLRPKIYLVLLFALLPAGFLRGILSYVLPLFNQDNGFPDLVIGGITLLVQFSSIFLIPQIIKYMQDAGTKPGKWVVSFLAVLSVLFILFSLDGTYRSFIPLLIATDIVACLLEVIGIRTNICEAGLSGINPKDTNVSFVITGSIGEFFRTMLFSLLLINGYLYFSLFWAILLAIFAIIALFISQNIKDRKTH